MIDRSISRAYRWKVQGRLAVLDYAAVHGVKPAAARFGLDRKTVRQWRVSTDGRSRENTEIGSPPTPSDNVPSPMPIGRRDRCWDWRTS